MNYDHDWKTQQSGCADNLWWLQVWKTQTNFKRFEIPEFERNCDRWDFLGERQYSIITNYRIND